MDPFHQVKSTLSEFLGLLMRMVSPTRWRVFAVGVLRRLGPLISLFSAYPDSAVIHEVHLGCLITTTNTIELWSEHVDAAVTTHIHASLHLDLGLRFLTISWLHAQEGLVLVGTFHVRFSLLEGLIASDWVEKLHLFIAIFWEEWLLFNKWEPLHKLVELLIKYFYLFKV